MIRAGEALPTGKELAQRYEVSAATAQRAVALLHEENLITVARGKRAIVAGARAAQPKASDP
ncbi:MAG: GntR family transcriptional regulator [Actinomycetia bacterium]|nr:GntR family transcriptional regulator [Actinomycetes bacterium]